MDTIATFITGIPRILLLFVSDRRLFIFIATLLLAIFVAMIYPTAIYISPFWKGQVSQNEVELFESQLKNLDVDVYAPDRLLPGRDGHEIIIEMQNLTNTTITSTLTVTKSQYYVNFNFTNTLPIVFSQEIPANARLINRLPFEVDISNDSYAPVEFAIGIQTPFDSDIRSFWVKTDYISLPIFAVVATVAPLLMVGIRMLIKAIIGM